MKKTELILGIISIFGLVLRLLQVPGSGILIMFTVTTLSIFYYIFGFAIFNNIGFRGIFNKESYKKTNKKKIIGTIGLGWSISIIIIGGLFKIQLYQGASIQLLFGLILIIILFLIALTRYLKNRSVYYQRVFKRIIIFGSLGLVLYLTPYATLVDIYFKDKPAYAELYKKVLENPKDIEIREQLKQMEREMLKEEIMEDLNKK